jgi:hypothetical protein
MKDSICLVSLLLLLISSCKEEKLDMVNPNASVEAKAFLKFLIIFSE